MADDAREHPVPAIALPPGLAPLLEGYRWSRDSVGESGDAVFRLHRADGGPDLYLKHGVDLGALDLGGEMVRLRWLARHVPVPAVRHFIAAPDQAWLLMTALPGRTASQRLEDEPERRAAIVDAIAALLRRLHAIPVESCPFNSDHRLRLGEARWRLEAGLIDPRCFDADRRGWAPELVWQALTALLPLAPDPVVTHGDLSLDNILLGDDGTARCIDVGRAGIADRYQDLAIVWRGLAAFGSPLRQRLLTAYGLGAVDERKLRFHLLLEELL